ncbi:hypothetical protein [Variovorax sp. N23]|uniref:hypothetical protein n=1 Tax=Variovorax sp. N23 TaxID=2980555 RepID=UPI0021C9E0B5|nr:hypothetical protein [Variovorax sp. N23]MCU4119333.1 hypothetical protein [Variovorax sp. N23]
MHLIRVFSDVSSTGGVCRWGASRGIPVGGRAHQKGRDFSRRHGLYFLSSLDWLGDWFDVESFLSRGTLMDQLEFPLYGRVDAPSVAPEQWVRYCKTYREAVRAAWALRRIKGAKIADMARDMQFVAQHVGDWLAKDDGPKRRSLPAHRIPDFELYVGNSLVSQWLASHAKLTVLEEITATRAVA